METNTLLEQTNYDGKYILLIKFNKDFYTYIKDNYEGVTDKRFIQDMNEVVEEDLVTLNDRWFERGVFKTKKGNLRVTIDAYQLLGSITKGQGFELVSNPMDNGAIRRAATKLRNNLGDLITVATYKIPNGFDEEISDELEKVARKELRG